MKCQDNTAMSWDYILWRWTCYPPPHFCNSRSVPCLWNISIYWGGHWASVNPLTLCKRRMKDICSASIFLVWIVTEVLIFPDFWCLPHWKASVTPYLIYTVPTRSPRWPLGTCLWWMTFMMNFVSLKNLYQGSMDKTIFILFPRFVLTHEELCLEELYCWGF